VTDDNDNDNDMQNPPFDISSLFQTARQMQEGIQKAQEQAASIRAEGNAGGGMVIAEANGKGIITRITVDDALFKSDDKEMLEDLTTAAVNQAITRAKQKTQEQLQEATGNLPIPPGLMNILDD
jgi:DNA-binding YbaB/EbfC family protein